MYDINFKNLKKGYKFGSIFLIAGLFFLILVGYFTFSGMFKKQAMDSVIEAYNIDENCGRDSDGDTLCSPIYYYKVDNIDYQCRINYSSSSGVKENQKNVYYDSKDPAKCTTDYEVKQPIFMYLILLFPFLFVYVGTNHIIKINKKIKKIKYLAQYGTLIQNLPYEMKATNMEVNGHQVLAPAVDYTLPSGSTIHLVGDPRYDKKQYDADGYVDLLIDLNDLENYYIDFNITRKM